MFWCKFDVFDVRWEKQKEGLIDKSSEQILCVILKDLFLMKTCTFWFKQVFKKAYVP